MSDELVEKKVPGKPFEKGDARINRGGRPVTNAEVRELLAAETLPSIQFLAEVRDDTDAPVQLRAWCADRLLNKTVPNAERLELPGGSSDTPGLLNARATLAARLAARLKPSGATVEGTVVEPAAAGRAAGGGAGPGAGGSTGEPGSK